MADLFTLFGTISVNADSANKTIDNTSSRAGGLSKTFDKVGNAAVKCGKVVAAGMAAGAAGVGVLLKSSVSAYSEYEQLVGGIDTLFKDSNAKVMEYASNAYKTAGLSANKYMETVTSFSASLLQGLGGDTAKAAEVADMAVTDMADNANKMGTPIESIQNAYQGFAKQNYTMLDNLKLGYGGTASEMARLINDSGVMGKKFKATAKNLKDIPFDKQIEAIHEMQVRMGIAGTTSLEASETIAGSWASLGAAWENLLVGMSDNQSDMDALFENIFVAGENVAKNVGKLLPAFTKNVGKLITNIAKSAGSKIQSVWENTIYPSIKDTFKVAFGITLPDWDKIKQTITTKWAEVKAAYDEGGLTRAFKTVLPEWDTLKATITTKWADVKTAFDEGGLERAFTVLLPEWENIKQTISTKWAEVKATFDEIGLTRIFEVLPPEWTEAVDTLKKEWNEKALPNLTDFFKVAVGMEPSSTDSTGAAWATVIKTWFDESVASKKELFRIGVGFCKSETDEGGKRWAEVFADWFHNTVGGIGEALSIPIGVTTPDETKTEEINKTITTWLHGSDGKGGIVGTITNAIVFPFEAAFYEIVNVWNDFQAWLASVNEAGKISGGDVEGTEWGNGAKYDYRLWGYSQEELTVLQNWIDAVNAAKEAEEAYVASGFADEELGEKWETANQKMTETAELVNKIDGIVAAYNQWRSGQTENQGQDLYLDIPLRIMEGAEGDLQTTVDGYDIEGEVELGADPESKTFIQNWIDVQTFTGTVTLIPEMGDIPGYAKGIDYVQEDNQLAYLHKGEAVLTAAEAAVWRGENRMGEKSASRTRRTSASSDQPINVTLNIQGVASNPYEIAGEVRNALELLRWQS